MDPKDPRADRPTNRLAREASPYLRQHAHNPVDWYPWGSEALERAKSEDRPILLSIGYSACHWCHVMERESFEDEAIASLMNERFVNVKVDREERPDLDHVYQLVVQLMGQGGGWPLTVFLTPDQRPFFGGTYFPPRDRYGRPGFPRVLRALSDAYRDQREDVHEQAARLTSAIAAAVQQGAPGGKPGTTPPGLALSPMLLERAAERLSRRFDDDAGGFGSAPKFPNTMALEVLLRRATIEHDAEAARRVRAALDAMQAGGIWDHLGGGFHRYSTDARWLVPHFEKMLYDNALLLRLYVDGYRAFGDPRYRETARAIAAYVEREMTDREGGFYAAEDADSEGEEGKFFVWSASEIEDALAGDAEAARVALLHYGVTPEGNFEGSGKTVLSAARAIEDVARELSLSEDAARAALERARARLYEVRAGRERPFRDEKVLASWTALMISALADASLALAEPRWLAMAEWAFGFLERTLVVEGGEVARVLRLAKDGVVKGPGFLDDVGYVANAALDLYEASGEPRYVGVAGRVVAGGVRHFLDRSPDGGFFFAPDDADPLIVRAKDPHDHAVPSGLSAMALAMLRLETLRGDDARAGRQALEALAGAAVDHPFGMSQIVNVLHRMVAGSVDVVVVGPRSDPRVRALVAEAFARPLLSRTLAWLDPSDPASIAACRALAEGKTAEIDAPVAYVCRGQTCSLPVSDPDALRALLV